MINLNHLKPRFRMTKMQNISFSFRKGHCIHLKRKQVIQYVLENKVQKIQQPNIDRRKRKSSVIWNNLSKLFKMS